MTDTETEEMHYKDGVNSHWKLEEEMETFFFHRTSRKNHSAKTLTLAQ